MTNKDAWPPFFSPTYPLITASGHEEGNKERKEEEKRRGQGCPMHLKIQRKECEENATVFGKRSQSVSEIRKGCQII